MPIVSPSGAATVTDGGFGSWFDQFVAELRSHQLQLEAGVASRELRSLYEGLMSSTLADLMRAGKQQAQQYFVTRMLVDFLAELVNHDSGEPLRLAVDYNDSEVMVWAEINDDEERLERALLLADATVSARYHDVGFAMITTIVEKRDHIPVPNHYRLLVG